MNARQIRYLDLALISSLSSESSNWQLSPYLRIDGSYTEFDEFSEIGGEAALTFDELTVNATHWNLSIYFLVLNICNAIRDFTARLLGNHYMSYV